MHHRILFARPRSGIYSRTVTAGFLQPDWSAHLSANCTAWNYTRRQSTALITLQYTILLQDDYCTSSDNVSDSNPQYSSVVLQWAYRQCIPLLGETPSFTARGRVAKGDHAPEGPCKRARFETAKISRSAT